MDGLDNYDNEERFICAVFRACNTLEELILSDQYLTMNFFEVFHAVSTHW